MAAAATAALTTSFYLGILKDPKYPKEPWLLLHTPWRLLHGIWLLEHAFWRLLHALAQLIWLLLHAGADPATAV